MLTLEQLSVNRPVGGVVKRFLPAKPSTVETDTRGQVGRVKLGACWQQEIEHRHFLGQTSTLKLEKRRPDDGDPSADRNLQNLILFLFPCLTHNFHVQHRFSAFWLRSKCSICSYQLNI